METALSRGNVTINSRFRTLLAFPILLALTTLVVGAVPVAARGDMALGISKSSGGESPAVLDSFTSSAGGNAPALWTLRSKWGSSITKNFPTAKAEALRDRGVTPFIWWTPTDPGNWERGRYERYQKTINGVHDKYIRKWAKAAAVFGDTVVLRLAHEPNVNYFPWGVGRFDNTPKKFKRAWRHIWKIFQQEGATNVKFTLSLAKKSCSGCNPYRKFYPGHKYVDYMAFTAFNWGPYKGGWVSMVETYKQPMKKFRQFTSKPVIVAETGSHFKGGNKARWIKNGYKKVFAKWSKIKAIVYLDTNGPRKAFGHPDWRLSKPKDGSALAAYAAVSSLPRFQGSLD